MWPEWAQGHGSSGRCARRSRVQLRSVCKALKGAHSQWYRVIEQHQQSQSKCFHKKTCKIGHIIKVFNIRCLIICFLIPEIFLPALQRWFVDLFRCNIIQSYTWIITKNTLFFSQTKKNIISRLLSVPKPVFMFPLKTCKPWLFSCCGVTQLSCKHFISAELLSRGRLDIR